jgi:predicted SAM-dependent methyltransferase
MIKLHLGSGKNNLDGWINVDHPRAPIKHGGKPDVRMDITVRKGDDSWERYENDSVDYIYTEHTIEHFHYNDCTVMLEECYRVLKPGGRIRIATPDLKFLIDLYNINKTPVQEQYMKYSCNNRSFEFVPHPIDTFVINNFVRDWNHTFIYDVKTLISLLTRCKFLNAREYSIGKSHTPVFKNIENQKNRVDISFYELETFVVEAKK